jgi:phosphoglycerate kinase
MQSIKNLKNLKNKKVLVRVDFNVPIKNGKVVDDFRIREALPTIKFLEKKGAQIILITHLGKDGSASLDPVIKRFFFLSKCSKKQVRFLENIRSLKGEIENDISFSRKLALEGNIFINEAFSVSHRQHASIVSLPKYLPSYAGFQLEKEIKNLNKIKENYKKPFLFILGGAKFSTKIPLIEKYFSKADFVFLGGALANNFLKAQGHEVGESLIEKDLKIEKFFKNSKLILPSDVLVSSENKLVNKTLNKISKNDYIVDIGKESIKKIELYIQKSKTILWNGPLGKYENQGNRATKKIIQNLLKQKNKRIVLGGGDLVSCLPAQYFKTKKINSNLFISTGGGATLEYLVQGNLPGIKALG